jgi:Domain of unknown function (DUF4276)
LSRLRIAPIVEGHGEDSAVRILLQRIWTELLGGEFVEVIKPIRGSRFKLVQPRELARAVDLAVLKLRSRDSVDPEMVLILLDAEQDTPCEIGPRLLAMARSHRSDADLSCVIANVMYETWFVAAAPSLPDHLDLSGDEILPESPERARLGKTWVQRRFKGVKYSETVDQPAMTRAMDLAQCRSKSPSFDKLCRDLDARLRRTGGSSER